MPEGTTFSELEAAESQETAGAPPAEGEGIEAPETPSQETPPEVPPQEEVIPEVDDRGVPAQNVLGEMRKKYSKVYEENQALRARLDDIERRMQSPAVDQQSTPAIQKSEAEMIQQIQTEVDQAIAEGKITTQGQAFGYYEQRRRELMPQPDITQAIQKQVQTMSTRGASEQRAIGEFPDLKDRNSSLSQAVLREIQARGKDYIEKNPYYLEEITPRIAMQMGIRPKSWNGSNQVRHKLQPGLADAGLRTPTKHQEIATPSDADKHLAQFFKTDPNEIAKMRKKQANQEVYFFEEM